MSETHFGYQRVDESEKEAWVGEVFDSVAGKYDIMNDVMSFGVHRFWKDWFVRQTGVKAGETVLDLAAGTGDISKRLARKMCHYAPGGDINGRLIVSDINASMLARGRERLIAKGWLKNVEFLLANAEKLPLENESVDLITMAFGLRNVTHQQQALNEMARVLKPGGRVMVLEFSHPKSAAFSKIYDWYSFRFLPKMGQVIANDSHSYQYLAESIRMMPNQLSLQLMFEDAGLVRCKYQNLTNGVVAIHQGFKE